MCWRQCWPSSALVPLILSSCILDFHKPSPMSFYPYWVIKRYIEHSWVTTTWFFLQEVHGTITLVNLWVSPPLDRVHDIFLMPAVAALATGLFLSSTELVKFNRCHLYLQVLTLSEILYSAGTSICPSFWSGNWSSRQMSLQWLRKKAHPCSTGSQRALCTSTGPQILIPPPICFFVVFTRTIVLSTLPTGAR